MEHMSEVLRILEAALRHDPAKAVNYATLLAAKLDEDKESRQARAIRATLAKSPGQSLQAASVREAVPIDEESRFQTVDVLEPLDVEPNLVLHPFVRDRLDDFLASVERHDEFAARGVEAANRLLIYGPPGTGKTTLARYVAGRVGLPLVTTRSDTLVSSLLGQTSRNIRRVFSYAQSNPSVLFLDEFDALAKSRNDTREVGELQRVVIALLENMDALPASTILIAATNHENLLDSAVWRRFEHTIEMGLPGAEQRVKLWRAKLGEFAPSPRDLDRLVDHSEGMSAAAIQAAARDIIRACISEGLSSPSVALAMRRIARVLWYDNYRAFDTREKEMAALRAWAPDVFSIRALAELFEVSTRQVVKATASKEVKNAAVRANPAGLVASS